MGLNGILSIKVCLDDFLDGIFLSVPAVHEGDDFPQQTDAGGLDSVYDEQQGYQKNGSFADGRSEQQFVEEYVTDDKNSNKRKDDTYCAEKSQGFAIKF
jgi:hypothetical protein